MSLAAQWVRGSPESASAWMRYALTLELSGERDNGTGERHDARSALDRARALDSSPAFRAQLAVARTRVALRSGDLKDALQIAEAGVADTALHGAALRSTIAPLAALIGNASFVLAGATSAGLGGLSQPLADSIEHFRTRATIGDCQALNASAEKLESLFRASVAARDQSRERERWLQPAYVAAAPCLGTARLREFTPTNPVERALHRLDAGDTQGALSILTAMQNQRGGATAAAVTWDYLFLQAWALDRAGSAESARRLILAALDDLSNISPYTLEEVAQAAGLRRSLWLLRTLDARMAVNSAWSAKSSVLFPRNVEIVLP